MDRSTAIYQLNLTTLVCQFCKKQFPTYRILITKNNLSTLGLQSQSHQKNKNNSTQTAQISENSLLRVRSNSINNKNSHNLQPRKYSEQNAQSIQKSNTSQLLGFQYICINCFGKNKIGLQQIHNETYFELANRYIKDIPIPDYSIAEQCKQILKQIQDKSTQIIKDISQKLDQFKFYILKLSNDVSKIYQAYIKKIKYFQQLRINQRYNIEMEIKNIQESNLSEQEKQLQKAKMQEKLLNIFYINQSQSIINLQNKVKQLGEVRNKISQIKFIMPAFGQEVPQIKRKKIAICDIPITSMINFNGRSYFGTADGKIIYEFKQKLISHKAHDSLIRSFSHDGQYLLYSGSDDFSIKAWDTHGEIKLLQTFGILDNNKSYHRNICVIDSGQALVSTRGQFDNYQIRVWSLQDQFENIGCLEGHTSFIRAMVVVDKAKDIIITGSDDKKIIIWDVKNRKILKVLHRHKKIINLIASQQHRLCAAIDEESRVSIIDLIEYTYIMGWTMHRKVLCSSGFNRKYHHSNQVDSDFLLISIPTNIGIWTWNGVKIWSFETQITFTPIFMMQVNDKIIVSGGTGTIDELIVGNISIIQEQYFINKALQ